MKKNILFILPWLPYPLKSGGHQAIYNGIKAVCNETNIIITYLTENNNSDIIKEFTATLKNNVIVEPYIISEKKRNLIRKIIHFLHVLLWNLKQFLINKKNKNISLNTDCKNYLEVLYPKNEVYINHIEKLIEKYKIDIVQCEMLGNSSLILNLPHHTKNIFVHHEIGFVRNEQEIKAQNDNSKLNKSFLEIFKIQEIGLLNRYDAIITLSEEDKVILAKAGTHTTIYPSIAIINNNYTFTKECKNYNILTFVGPEFHTPNKEGIMWFLENCWEEIKEKDATYKLNIIGNWSENTQKIISNKYKDIYFCGYVENLENELRNTIMIVPINIGSGIRMKILEAAAIGVPVVSTTIGISGIAMLNEKHCLIGDTPTQFAASIFKYKDKELRLKTIENANNLVKNNYSFDALRENRLTIYETIA